MSVQKFPFRLCRVRRSTTQRNGGIKMTMMIMTIITVIINDSEIEKLPPLPVGLRCVAGLAHGLVSFLFERQSNSEANTHTHTERERKETTHILSLQQ